MKTTAQVLQEFLDNPENIFTSSSRYFSTGNGFDKIMIRVPFRLANGSSVSIQQSASHYCTKAANTFEVWNCQHNEVLGAHGNGENPYSHVPFDTVVAYIDSQGGPGESYI